MRVALINEVERRLAALGRDRAVIEGIVSGVRFNQMARENLKRYLFAWVVQLLKIAPVECGRR